MKSKKYALLALLLWATAMIPKDVMGQCTNCNANYPYLNGGYSTTSSAWTILSSSVEGGDYSCYNVSTSYMYQWTTCPSSTGGYDTQLTLYTSSTGSCSGTSVYNDDYCGTRSLVSYKPSSNGGVRCLVSKYNCATDATLTYFTTLQWRAIPQTPTITGGGVTICSGSSTILTASNIGSNNDDYVDVQWSTSSSGGTDVSSDATSITVSPTSTTTYYCRYYVKGGGATYSNIASATVTVISSNAGTVTQTPASGSTVCDGGGVQYSCSGITGTFNQFEYQWNGTGGGWSALSSSNPYTWTANSPGNTLYVRSKVTNGVCAAAYSSPVSVVVASDPAAPTATKSPNDATVCVGQTLTLTGVTDNGGGTGSCQIEYCYSTNGGSSYSAWSTTLPSFAASGSDNRIKVRKYCNGTGCGYSGENTYSWSVVADPAVTISGGGAFCVGTTVNLSSVITGGTGTQSLQWQSSSDNINFTNISGATSASYTAPTSSAGTTYYRLIVNYTGSGCTQATSASQNVSVFASNTWIGGTSTVWANSTNWCLSGSVPSSTTDIIIPDAALTANDPGISALSSCRNITIHSGGVLNISNAQLDVYGNWSNSGTANTTTAWIKFTGSSAQQMSASQPVNYLLVDNAAGLTLTGALTVNSGLSLLNGTLTNGANLTMANTSVITRYSGSIASAPTFAGLVDVNYMTSGNVTTGAELPSSASVLRNLGVQVGAGNVVTLNAAARVNGQLNLNTGVLRTSSTNLLTLSDGVTVSGASNNSFVDGPVSKIGDDAFEFPTGDVVGSTFVWAPIAMADPGSSTSDRFTAEYTLQAAPYNWAAGDMCDVNDMNHVSGVEYWDIVRNTGSTYPDLTLYWKDASRSGIADVPNIVLGHREACGWKRMSGSASGTTGPGGTGSVTGSGFTSYSPITFGTKNMNNPLPVSLVEFSGTCSNNSVSLFWMTASETNNEFFTVERSRNATEWETAGTVDGAGNSNSPLNYRFIDDKAYDGYSYYRLKQSDFDGKSETFSPIVVSCEQGNPYEINVYPNPFKNELILRFANVSSDKANVMIYDLLGTNIMNREYVIGNGIDRIELDMSGIATGVYYIEFNAGDVRFRTKVVKN